MAAVTKGTAHLFGIGGTISNVTITSFKTDTSPGVKETTADENGIIVERRYDDTMTSGTLTVRPRSGYTVPAIGDIIAGPDSVSYIVEGLGKTFTAGKFREYTLSVLTSSGISLA